MSIFLKLEGRNLHLTRVSHYKLQVTISIHNFFIIHHWSKILIPLPPSLLHSFSLDIHELLQVQFPKTNIDLFKSPGMLLGCRKPPSPAPT